MKTFLMECVLVSQSNPLKRGMTGMLWGKLFFLCINLRSPHKSGLPLGPEENPKRLEAHDSLDHMTGIFNNLDTIIKVLKDHDIEELKAFLQLAEECK